MVTMYYLKYSQAQTREDQVKKMVANTFSLSESCARKNGFLLVVYLKKDVACVKDQYHGHVMAWHFSHNIHTIKEVNNNLSNL